MIVSDSHKFVCLRPWKAGSSTLGRRLEDYASERYHVGEGEYLGRHVPLSGYLASPEAARGYVLFTFLRNPYDRIYSGFEQRKDRLGKLGQIRRGSWLAKERHAIDQGFPAFVRSYARRYKAKGDIVGRFLHEYVFHDGRAVVDFVGCVETFEASYAHLCGMLGIESDASVLGNVRVRNVAHHQAADLEAARHRYLGHYDAATIRAVNRLYRKDFELLGYRMLDPRRFEDGAPADIGLSPFAEGSLIARLGRFGT